MIWSKAMLSTGEIIVVAFFFLVLVGFFTFLFGLVAMGIQGLNVKGARMRKTLFLSFVGAFLLCTLATTIAFLTCPAMN